MVEWKKLGEVCDILNGFAFKSQEYVSEGIRIIRISDVQSGCISDKDKVFYPVEKVSEFERYLLHQGDLVMSLTGNPGRIAIIKDDSCALNQRVACLRANDVSRSFLFYLFNCKEFESIAFANSTGGAQKNLSTAWLNNYRIPIPSLSEQQRIVSILDTFTSSISNLKQQIEERRKQYEYERNLLLDLEGKEGVEMKKLGEVGDICMCKRIMKDQTSEKGDIPFFKIGTFGGKADAYISRELFEDYKEKYSYPKKGEILISAAGTIGRTVVFNGEDAYFQDSNIVWISNNEQLVLNTFLRYLYGVIDWKIDGGTIKRLYNYNLKNATIYVPTLQAQSRIVSILDTFEQSISNLEEQLAMREKQYEYYRNQLLTFEGEEERGKT